MEDTSVTKNEIEVTFGKPVADMVDGVSKLDQIEFTSKEEAQAENFRKMLLAMARDVRVILIKLADRLHNMRTLDAMSPVNRRRIARETLDIYAPIANRLGLNALYLELQDLSFKHLNPMRYRVLANAIKAARGNRREVMNRLLDAIREGYHKAGIHASVTGREKTVYSVYKKMREKRYTFSQVFDIYGVRVLVADPTACYAALGVAARALQADPGQVQGLRRDPQGERLPVAAHDAVRPLRHAARGADPHARHAPHRRGGRGRALAVQDAAASSTSTRRSARRTRWLQSLLEIQSESRDSKEFLENIKGDLFPEEIYVFTPKGKIMALPRGATAVDFAYGVHTDIGHHCVAARINYELLPLRTELKNGDHVEILTSPTARPNPSWLSFVATGKARSRIRHYLKGLQQKESAALGERLLEPGARHAQGRARRDHLGALGVARAGSTARRASSRSSPTSGSASGCRSWSRRRSRAVPGRSRGRRSTPAGEGRRAHLRGVEGVAIQYAKCCRPIPGDAIVGQFRKGQGLVVHTARLRHAQEAARRRRPSWSTSSGRPTCRACSTPASACSSPTGAGCSPTSRPRSPTPTPTSTTSRWSSPTAASVIAMFFSVQVRDRRHLAHVMRDLRRVPDVRRVQRART